MSSACSRTVNLLGPHADAGGNDTLAPTDGAPVDLGMTNPACTNPGPPIVLPTNTGAPCAGALAATGHRFALCSCDGMNAPARVRTAAYDSRDPARTNESSAAIGIGGDLVASAEVRAGGAFWVGGPGGINATSSIRSSTTMYVGGPFVMHSDHADIGGDAYVSGAVTGDVRVSGTLHVPPGTVVSGGEAGAVDSSQPVTVGAPCDCSAGFIDIAGAITAAAATNADDAIGLAPTALASVSTPTSIALPCGTFYLSTIFAPAAVTIVVHGRTLLAIDGDVTVRGGLDVRLDPSAELDLLVRGQVIASGGSPFGATGAAARFRVWIAGTSTIVFDNAPIVSAVIRAPAATVNATSGLPLYGSLLARSASIGADSMLEYDLAILEAGAVCNAPPASPVP